MLNDTTTSSSPSVTSSRDDVITRTTNDVTDDAVPGGAVDGGHDISDVSQKIEYDVEDMAATASAQ